MKKHQLLEKAMLDYPAGTKFKTVYHGIELVSTGIFSITNATNKSCAAIIVVQGNLSDDSVYCFHTNEWAEIIPSSEPLKLENISVKVNNEREFKLLMKHYDELGWKWNVGHSALEFSPFNYPFYVWYEDSFVFDGLKTSDGRQLVDFDFFCDQKGITIPKPILTSVDGVEMFEGDDYYEASYYDGGKVWQYVHGPSHKIKSGHRVVEFTEFNKAFASKEAAESWISEQNKPKEIDLSIDAKNFFTVTKYGIKISLLDKRVLSINPSIIEEILKAYKSLQ